MDPNAVLDKLNILYSNAFNNLILITGIITAFYIALPFVLTYLQNKSLEKERDNLKEEMKQDFDNIKKSISSEIITLFDNEKNEIRSELKIGISRAEGYAFFQQGLGHLRIKEYHKASKSFFDAFFRLIQTEDERNIRYCLQNLLDYSIPKLDKNDFEDEELEKQYQNFLNLLENKNVNGRYFDELTTAKRLIKDAKSRESSKTSDL